MNRKLRKLIKNPIGFFHDMQRKREINIIEKRYIPSKEKLLFVSQEMTYTGSPNSLLRMARVASKFYNVSVLSFEKGPFQEEFKKSGFDVYVCNKDELSKPYVQEYILSHDFCIANTIGTSDFVKLYKEKIPVYWYIREAHNLTSYHKGRQNVLQGYKNVWCVSEYAKEFIDKNFKTNAVVCHNAVEDKYTTSKATGPIKILFSGTLSGRKGLDTLVQAWKRIHESYPKVELLIAGRILESFQKFCDEHLGGALDEKNIHYIGEIRDRAKYFDLLSSVDIVAVPSRDESCSLVALEAAMMSKTLLVSKNVGAKYICGDNEEQIFNTGDADDLAIKLQSLIELGRTELEKVGDLNRKRYLEDSTFEAYSKRFEKLLSTMKKNQYQPAVVNKNPKNSRRYKFVRYDELELLIQQSINKFRKYDLIVGIPRSGMIPAYMIAFMLNKRVCSLNEFLAGDLRVFGYRKIQVDECKNILILDDSMLSGRSIKDAKGEIEKKGLHKSYNIQYGCVFATEKNKDQLDLYVTTLEPPRLFQWNYLNHPHSVNWCFDIDGVLCEDPPSSVNDDGPLYSEFILNAPLLFKPNYKLGALVTSRLLKYKSLTEKWAANNGIEFKELAMLDLPDKKTRIKLKAHTKTKIEFYKDHPEYTLFIESERNQAEKIAKETGKPVICVGTNEFFDFGEETAEPIEIYPMKKFCNVCNTSFEDFSEFGSTSRRVKCPNCGSVDRTRLLWIRVLSEIPRLKGKQVLLVKVNNKIIRNLVKVAGAEIKSVDSLHEVATGETFNFIMSEDYIFNQDAEKQIEKLVAILCNGGECYLPVTEKQREEISSYRNGLVFEDMKSSGYPAEFSKKFNLSKQLVMIKKNL